MTKTDLINISKELFVKYFFISHKFQYLCDYELGKDQLTTKQALAIIAIEEGFSSPPSIREVSDLLGTTRQNITQLIYQLEKKGFLTTERDNNDKRNLRLKVTEKNQKYWESRATEHDQFIYSLFATFTEEEIHVLRKLTDKLLENIDWLYKTVKNQSPEVESGTSKD